jgi:hypothetical protein
MTSGTAIEDRAAQLARESLFSYGEWIDTLTLIRVFRCSLRDRAPLLRTARQREAVERLAIDAARFTGARPSETAGSLLSAMAAYQRLRKERRRGGGPLAVDGREYRRRLRARRRRRR